VIASARGVVVAWLVAGLLALAALRGPGRATPAPGGRAIAPGFAADAVAALEWSEPSAGRAATARVARSAGSPTGWAIEAPAGAADAGAVEAVLAALRGGRWHREGPATLAEPAVARLEVSWRSAAAGAAALAIAIGPALAAPAASGEAQRWIAAGGRALLVDAWIARALAPGAGALRVRRPLAEIARAPQIELELAGPGPASGAGAPGAAIRAALAGSPRRLGGPHGPLLAPDVVREIEEALAAIELAAGAGSAAGAGAAIAPGELRATAGGWTLEGAGRCAGPPGRWAVAGTAGPGCVDARAWARAEAAVAQLRAPLTALVDPRPLAAGALARVVLGDRAVLELSGRPQIDGHEADPAAVAALLAALAGPAIAVVPAPGGDPRATLVATPRAGAGRELALYAPDLVVRGAAGAREPVALRLPHAAWRALIAPRAVLRDPSPWREEPTAIASIAVGATTYARGATLGEWTRAGPGPDDPAAVDRLVAALAAPAARPAAGPIGAPRHRVALRVVAAGAPPTERALDLGRTAAGGCGAAIGDRALALPAEVCALATRLAEPTRGRRAR
jgi:hypothetical protein